MWTNGASEEVAKWTVLIVDDEPDNLGVPLKTLTHFGATVYTAEDGQQALTLLSEVEPTFVLLDLSMPVMDGWETIREMRNNPRTTSLPVIALTAHAMGGDKQRAMDAGFDGYITKPFRIATFLNEIQECLDHISQNSK